MRRQAMKSKPVTKPALARTAFPKPRRLPRVLFSIMGWMTAPSDEPDATIVIARARRLRK
jgi:hypothetical protein